MPILEFIGILPIAIIYIIAITLACLRWKRHPKASLFTVLGFGTLLATIILSRLGQTIILHSDLSDRGLTGVKLSILSLVSLVFTLIGTTLVITAIFAGRR
jgi:hypothetical protein